MNVRTVARGLYATFGLIYLIAGIGILAYRTGLLPPIAIDLINALSDNNSNTLHIMQEFGTHLVAIGIVALWFAKHYEQSWVFHWAMTVAWGAFGLVHWIDVRGPTDEFLGPFLTTVPFLVYAVVGVWRWRGEKA